jgi:hypothetical protein
MIPARVRAFSIPAIKQVVGLSRTTLWRKKQRGRLGVDVVRFVQDQRKTDGLPPLSEEEVAELLAALVAVEDARARTIRESVPVATA